MKAVKAIELARTLGISRRTMSGWCRADPALAYKKEGVYWIRLERLAQKPGLDIVSVLTGTQNRWIKAIDLARWAGIPRETVAYWCRKRPRFAKRIGRLWYVSLDELGCTSEQAEALRKWVPDRGSIASFVEFTSRLSNEVQEEA
jgi:hypothetical protein